MPTQEELLQQMLQLLSVLIESAKKMKEAQDKSIAETELELMQERQAEIIKDLVQLDLLIKKSPLESSADALSLQKEIEGKLLEFQSINTDFFEHLQSRMSLIHFTSPKLSAEEEDLE